MTDAKLWSSGARKFGRISLIATIAWTLCLAPKLPGFQAPEPQALPHRIISLIPSVTEMLFAIGAGPAVVGVSSFDHFPPEAEQRTKVGGLIDPDFERILSLRPDLVIVYGTQSELIDRLRRAGISMFNYQHAGLPDITQTIRQVGERVGRAESARSLAADIERRIAAIRAATRTLPRPKTMLVFEREPGTLRGIYGSGGVGFLHDMLEAAGGDNLMADIPRQSVQITTELAMSRAPEVIIEIHSGAEWTPARATREREVWRALPSIPAVRSGRIYVLADERLSIPGPRVADAVQTLARILHPGAFK